MTPEQEIAGLKTILNGWKKDCQHYEQGLRDVRKSAMQSYDVSDHESDAWLGLISQINSVLAHDEQCPTCGDSDCNGGLPCESGDGV